MKETNQLIDTAKVKIRAGRGGDGRVSFRREKFIPKGGPDGGNGGIGGSVYLVANNNMETLLDFRSKAVFSGHDGEPGGKKNMSGSAGEDAFINVPLGTLVYEERPTGRVLVADMIDPAQKFLIARGGHGGRGNYQFKSSLNQAPMQYTEGVSGEEKTIWFEIKLMADVGLVGFPNAGKSTLLNVLTHANVKVSNYPFTTLHPNLGVLRTSEGREIVFADIPGLIEGASTGKGLGDGFLKHIERTRIIVHIIDPSDMSYTDEGDFVSNSLKQYDILRQELKVYAAGLETKTSIVVINKIDITEVNTVLADITKAFAAKGIKVLGISGASVKGIKPLVGAILEALSKEPQRISFEAEQPVKIFNINNLPNKRIVFNDSVLNWEGDKHVA